jgi:hypothetical protein
MFPECSFFKRATPGSSPGGLNWDFLRGSGGELHPGCGSGFDSSAPCASITLVSAEDSVPVQEAIRELMLAYRDVRNLARKHEATLARALKRLEPGEEVLVTFEAMPPGEPRKEAIDVLDALERARHTVRLAVIGDCLASGMTIGELGRRWGFSRQLAARYVKEIRDQSDPDR